MTPGATTELVRGWDHRDHGTGDLIAPDLMGLLVEGETEARIVAGIAQANVHLIPANNEERKAAVEELIEWALNHDPAPFDDAHRTSWPSG